MRSLDRFLKVNPNGEAVEDEDAGRQDHKWIQRSCPWEYLLKGAGNYRGRQFTKTKTYKCPDFGRTSGKCPDFWADNHRGRKSCTAGIFMDSESAECKLEAGWEQDWNKKERSCLAIVDDDVEASAGSCSWTNAAAVGQFDAFVMFKN